MSLLASFLRTESKRFSHGYVGTPGADLRANERYLQIALKSLHLPYTRKGFREFYGVVHAFTRLSHEELGDIEFQFVSTPGKLTSVDASQGPRMLTVDKLIVGPTPYRGGATSLEIGLLSVQARDLAGPLLSMIGDISKIIGVSFLGTGGDLVRVVEGGVAELVGDRENTRLEVGLNADFSELRTGHYAVVAAASDEVDMAAVAVQPDGRLVASGARELAVPYFVLEIRGSLTRDDWSRIPDLRAAYMQLKKPFEQQATGDLQALFPAFERTVLLSPDLLEADASRIVAAVRAKFEKLAAARLVSHESAAPFPALEDIAIS